MPDFPDSIYSPRSIENRPGVVYDPDDVKTFFAEDLEKSNDEIVAIENALGEDLGNIGLNGWIPLSLVPVLSDSDDPNYLITFSADVSSILTLGSKIKLTQGAVIKYFFVVKIGTFADGEIDVVVYGGTDYDLTATGANPISNVFFSLVKSPFGFPLNPAKWTVRVVDSSNRSQATPTQNAWYNLNSNLISVPIGAWRLSYAGSVGMSDSAIATLEGNAALSTANNSLSDAELQSYIRLSVTSGSLSSYCLVAREKFIAVTVKTNYYFISRTQSSGVDTLYNRFDECALVLQAVCVYL